jgi:hypothetical protein
MEGTDVYARYNPTLTVKGEGSDFPECSKLRSEHE